MNKGGQKARYFTVLERQIAFTANLERNGNLISLQKFVVSHQTFGLAFSLIKSCPILLKICVQLELMEI